MKGEKVYRGTAVSAGVCRGKVLVLHRTRHLITQRVVSDAEIIDEIKRFEQVLVKTRTQIKEVQRRVVKNMSAAEADIFDDPRSKSKRRFCVPRSFGALRRRDGRRGG